MVTIRIYQVRNYTVTEIMKNGKILAAITADVFGKPCKIKRDLWINERRCAELIMRIDSDDKTYSEINELPTLCNMSI